MKKQSPDPKVSKLFGTGIMAAETAAAKLRKRLLSKLQTITDPLNQREFLTLARKELFSFAPLYAQILLDSQIAAWVSGLEVIANKTPQWARDIVSYGVVNPGKIDKLSNRDKIFASVLTGEILPAQHTLVVFPALQESVARLINKRALRKSTFEKLTPLLASRAFTVANISTVSKVDEIKEAIVRSLVESRTLPQFREDIVEIVGSGKLAPHHVENIFRTNMQKAYGEGQEQIISHPLVAPIFPYAAYYAIDDSRVRDNHLALMKLGLDETNIYRADDPMWEFFTPPVEWNCVLPGQMVQARNVQLAFRSFYEGTAVEIKTNSGNVFAVTANHGVVTAQGVVKAGDLGDGMNVISYKDMIEGNAVLSQDIYHKPVPIEEAFASLAMGRSLCNRPTAVSDFHGDAQWFKHRNVDVVGSLSDAMKAMVQVALNPAFIEFFVKSNIQFGNSPSIAPHLFHHLLALCCRDAFPAKCHSFGPASRVDVSLYKNAANDGSVNCEFVCDSQYRHPLLVQASNFLFINLFASMGTTWSKRYSGFSKPLHYRRVAHSELSSNVKYAHFLVDVQENYLGDVEFDRALCGELGDGFFGDLPPAVSDDNAIVLQKPRNGFSPNTNFFSDLITRFPGLVFLDPVVSIRHFNYSGPVYDLQTSTGTMVINNVQLQQCRCGKKFMTIRQAAQRGVTEAMKWLKSGIPPEHPEHRLDHIPFRPDPTYKRLLIEAA